MLRPAVYSRQRDTMVIRAISLGKEGELKGEKYHSARSQRMGRREVFLFTFSLSRENILYSKVWVTVGDNLSKCLRY